MKPKNGFVNKPKKEQNAESNSDIPEVLVSKCNPQIRRGNREFREAMDSSCFVTNGSGPCRSTARGARKEGIGQPFPPL